MILDARDHSVPLDRVAQIAIAGAGPSGLVLARELARAARVLVIESGGFDADDALDALQLGESVGIGYPLVQTRTRRFGGSSALWAGYCAVFDPHDFARRDWVPGSGWPFGIDALEPYFAKAAELLNLGEADFDAREIAARAGVPLPFDNDLIVPSVWRFGTPTLRIAEHLRDELEATSNLTTLMHANIVDMRLDAEHSMVTELVVRTLDGREGRVAADLFVLACGGIEVPRILLNADTQIGRGLGNAHDLVGRYFMEHPHLSIESLALHAADSFQGWAERGSYHGGRQYASCMGLSPLVQQEARILNARGHIYRTPGMTDEEIPKVGMFLEQAPSPASRVTLSDDTDCVGMRRVRLDWRLTELDWKTYEQTARIFGREFERAGAGRMGVPNARDDAAVLHSNHHLGTTRMAESPEHGVVDPDCRVHELANLYVAGGSVFPTVSWANPTFTLIALVFRLADHLTSIVQSRLARFVEEE
jgi:choline dehydrogenase-like flavoprotein